LSGISPLDVRATIWRVLLSAHGISGIALACGKLVSARGGRN
jgi:hypothetical protein